MGQSLSFSPVSFQIPQSAFGPSSTPFAPANPAAPTITDAPPIQPVPILAPGTPQPFPGFTPNPRAPQPIRRKPRPDILGIPTTLGFRIG